MPYNFSPLNQYLKDTSDWLTKELAAIRTGRATPLLVENVLVESYGTKTPLKHVAAIAVEDQRTLRLTPWDGSQIKSLESSIAAANLGVSTNSDSSSVRVIFPELTSERRQTLAKAVKEKLEAARIKIRQRRDEAWSDIQEKARRDELTEDEKYRFKDELQKIVDETNHQLEALAEKKEKELTV